LPCFFLKKINITKLFFISIFLINFDSTKTDKEMKNLTVKTIGMSPAYPSDSIDLDAKMIADALQGEISGGKATDLQVNQLTQEFVTQFNITAKYASGTFLGFKISDDALDQFETFKKR